MKLIFTILLFFLTNQVFSLDYILEFQANINILKEFIYLIKKNLEAMN